MRVTTRSKRRMWGARLACAGVTTAVALGIAASPALAAEVPPIFVPGHPAAVCPAGSQLLSVEASNTPQTFHIAIPGDGSGDVTLTFTNGNKELSFDIAEPNSIAVSQVTVAGGPNANRYIYDAATGFPNGIDSDTGLFPPLNPGGQMPGIGRVDFCFVPDNYS
ncbi:hypothetical protein [Streptomyces sp. IBSBF 3136]|uniref:hypothetical protein n=1 Tax=Streptomyces sp. IBSBF 3136 TaxID=2903524 RepID=UPI002FDBE76F